MTPSQAKRIKVDKFAFDQFNEVRASGRANMADYRTVAVLACISEDQAQAIVHRYDALKRRFGRPS